MLKSLFIWSAAACAVPHVHSLAHTQKPAEKPCEVHNVCVCVCVCVCVFGLEWFPPDKHHASFQMPMMVGGFKGSESSVCSL